MVRLIFIFICCCIASSVHAGCRKNLVRDFSTDGKMQISSESHVYLGQVANRCWYFQDILFKNDHGQQAIVVNTQYGRCVGFFRISLADTAEIHGSELSIKSFDGKFYKVDLSKGMPKEIFFDGENLSFESCL